MRGFEALVRRQPGVDYTSFDLARHTMERGDITAMRYDTDSVDFFVCFHVLEHVADEAAALSEIHRVLRPGGTAVLQVPVDWDLAETYEYASSRSTARSGTCAGTGETSDRASRITGSTSTWSASRTSSIRKPPNGSDCRTNRSSCARHPVG